MTRRDLLQRGLRAFGVIALGGAFYRRAARAPDIETLRLVNPDDATHYVDVYRVRRITFIDGAGFARSFDLS